MALSANGASTFLHPRRQAAERAGHGVVAVYRCRMSWVTGRLVAFDLETTGVDVESARIVTAAVLVLDAGKLIQERFWLLDPGIVIPEQASRVHGIITEREVTFREPGCLGWCCVAIALVRGRGRRTPKRSRDRAEPAASAVGDTAHDLHEPGRAGRRS